jgi:hypothetical protein
MNLLAEGEFEQGSWLRSTTGSAWVSMWRLGGIVFLGCLSAVACSSSLEAVEWSEEAAVQARQEYNDNVQLTAAPHDSVLGSIVSSSLKLAARAQQAEVRGSGLIEFNHYFGEEDLDSTDYFLGVSSLYKTERGVWGLDGGYTRDLTLRGELNENGMVLKRAQRLHRSVNPSWSWSATEKTGLKLGYQFADVGYADSATGLADYQIHAGRVQVIHTLNDLNQIDATISYTHYQLSSANFRSENYSARVSLSHPFSESLKGTFSGGLYYTANALKMTDLSRKDPDRGWLAAGSLEQQSQYGVLRGSVGREISPSGAGYLVRVDRLSGLMHRRLTERLTAFLSTDFYLSKPIRKDVAVTDSFYYRIKTGWSWIWKDRWSIDTAYGYARQKYEHAQVVTSNTVYWSVSYNAPRVVVSP